MYAGVFFLAFILGTLFCAARGALLASPASDSPPNVMIFSNLVQFQLLFISGIFVPLSQIQGGALTLAYCSLLTYLVDLFNAAMIGTSVFSRLLTGGAHCCLCRVYSCSTGHPETEYDEGDVREKKNVKIWRILLTRFSSGIKDPALERGEHAFSRDECPGQVPLIQATTNQKKENTCLLVNAEAIDDKPVFYEYITPQAIALCYFYFFGNP